MTVNAQHGLQRYSTLSLAWVLLSVGTAAPCTLLTGGGGCAGGGSGCTGVCVHHEVELAFTLSADLAPTANLSNMAELAAVRGGENALEPVGLRELHEKEHCECVLLPALPRGFSTRANFVHFCDFSYFALSAAGICVGGTSHLAPDGSTEYERVVTRVGFEPTRPYP